jgi:hypothetical protein
MNPKIIPGSFLLIVMMLFTSCFKEDEQVAPQKPGNVETVVIEMLPNYNLQSWFDLSEGKAVAVNERSDWDLALSTAPDDYTLWLNTSVFMNVAHTGIFDFSTSLATNNREWKFDASNGNPDENAIGKWWASDETGFHSLGEVLLIDRGIDEEGYSRGFLKIQPLIDSHTGQVMVRIAKPDGAEERTFEMPKDPTHRRVTLSFDRGYNAEQPEPTANNWDLLFTTYTTLLFTNTGDPYPYLVNGVLLNDTLAMAAMDSITPFADIDREMAETFALSRQKDTIGYQWKKINGDVTSGNVTYTVRSDWSYIIKDGKGLLYKLRFIDFYNNQGKKGYPTFEFQRL